MLKNTQNGGTTNEVSDKRFHIAVKLTEEEKWKLREIAARKKLKVTELVLLRIKEIIEVEDANSSKH